MREPPPPEGFEAVSDETLMGQVADDVPDALATLYDRYGGIAYGLALRVTRDPTLAEDVVQEAFTGAWRNAGRYSPERARPRTWLLSIVHHRAVDAVRRRRTASELPVDEELPPTFVVEDVWQEVAGRLDRDAVLGALASLPAPQREAIELAYFGGLTQTEIAARTDTPLGTVKSRVRLGLFALRDRLADAVDVRLSPDEEAGARPRAAVIDNPRAMEGS